MRKFFLKFTALSSVVWLSVIPACTSAHDAPSDNLLGASVRVISSAPLTVVVMLEPRADFAEVIVKSTNSRTAADDSCRLSGLTRGQRYECRLSGEVQVAEPDFLISVSGHTSADEQGHRHVSSNILAIENPNFSIQEFRARRTAEAAAATKRSSGSIERIRTQ